MTWFSVEITEACVLGGAYHRLCRQFQQAFIAAGAPEDMALFAQTLRLDDTRKIYFSPGSIPYVQSVIEAYGGRVCERPALTDVTLVFGVPDAGMRLLGGDEEVEVDGRLEEATALLATSETRRARMQEAVPAS